MEEKTQFQYCVYLLENSSYTWNHGVQTCIVQGLIVTVEDSMCCGFVCTGHPAEVRDV